MLLKFVGVFALGGIVLSFFNDGDVRGYFFGGALMGLFYFLLALFTNAVTNEE